MEFYLKLTILLLCILIIFLIILTVILLFYVLKKNKLKIIPPKQAKKESYCVNHPKKESSGICGICNDTFCDSCLSKHDNLNFCKLHFDLFLNSQWKEICNITTTPDNPEKGTALYNLKENLWNEKSIPSYVVTHYRINFDGDFIESHIGLFCRDQDEIHFKERLSD